MVRKPGGCEESLLFIIVSSKRLCQVWQKWPKWDMRNVVLNFPRVLWFYIKILKFLAFNAKNTAIAQVYPSILQIELNPCAWTQTKIGQWKKAIGLVAGVLLILGSVGLVKYAGVEFANSSMQSMSLKGLLLPWPIWSKRMLTKYELIYYLVQRSRDFALIGKIKWKFYWRRSFWKS